MTTSPNAPKRATLTSAGPGERFTLPVDFNPTSLQYTVKNTFKNQRGNDKKKQNVTQSSAQLSMDLVFDSTDTGRDVREKTNRIALMLKPVNKVPPTVVFEWGAYYFEGFVESHKETLDFFSHDGVPLRAAISLTLTQKENVFTVVGSADQQAEKLADPFVVPSSSNLTPGEERKVAEDNNLESPRDTDQGGGDVPLLAFPDITIGPPLAFASGAAGAGISAGAGASAGAGFAAEASIGASAGIGAGASAGASAGFGAGASAGFSAGASAGFSAGFSASASAGASAGFGAGAAVETSFGVSAGASAGTSVGGGAITGAAFGSAASAGVSASAGAFAGLQVPKVTKSVSLDTSQLIETSKSVRFSTEQGASFEVGGKARAQGSAGFSTNVDAATGLTSRIEFED